MGSERDSLDLEVLFKEPGKMDSGLQARSFPARGLPWISDISNLLRFGVLGAKETINQHQSSKNQEYHTVRLGF